MLKKIISKIPLILTVLLLIFSATTIVASRHILTTFGKGIMGQIIYYAFTNFNAGSNALIIEGIRKNIILLIIILFILLCPLTNIFGTKNIIELTIFRLKQSICCYPINIIRKHYFLYALCICVLSFSYGYYTSGFSDYIKSLNEKTNIYDKYYVDPSTVNVIFPEDKQNLIIIFLESIENSFLSKKNGGLWEKSLIPELERLAQEHTNFSNSETIGGAFEDWGAACTVCSMVAQTAGIPSPNNIISSGFENDEKTYLPGAYSLGDILKKEEYNLELMFGSDASFGRRDSYFKTHGDYSIYDYKKAKEEGVISNDYKIFWGFEDKFLFEYAKEKITLLAKEDKPFNFILLTVDTHDSGYLDSSCNNNQDYSLENIISCSADKTTDFIKWITLQNFYDNTTIVIVGDHLVRQINHFPNKDFKNYDRTVYNAIINSKVEINNTKNRLFSLYDMYPTILASIGVKIEGNRLGLGTNLYTGEKTLIEKMGREKFGQEIIKNSSYYNSNLAKKQ